MGSCGSLEVRVTEASHPGLDSPERVLGGRRLGSSRVLFSPFDGHCQGCSQWDIQKSGFYAHGFSVSCASEVTQLRYVVKC